MPTSRWICRTKKAPSQVRSKWAPSEYPSEYPSDYPKSAKWEPSETQKAPRHLTMHLHSKVCTSKLVHQQAQLQMRSSQDVQVRSIRQHNRILWAFQNLQFLWLKDIGWFGVYHGNSQYPLCTENKLSSHPMQQTAWNKILKTHS